MGGNLSSLIVIVLELVLEFSWCGSRFCLSARIENYPTFYSCVFMTHYYCS